MRCAKGATTVVDHSQKQQCNDVLDGYLQAGKELLKSSNPADRQLAAQLSNFIQSIPAIQTRAVLKFRGRRKPAIPKRQHLELPGPIQRQSESVSAPSFFPGSCPRLCLYRQFYPLWVPQNAALWRFAPPFFRQSGLLPSDFPEILVYAPYQYARLRSPMLLRHCSISDRLAVPFGCSWRTCRQVLQIRLECPLFDRCQRLGILRQLVHRCDQGLAVI